MTIAGTIAYKFLAHYLHVYTSMPVSATQVESTFDLLACNLRVGTREGYETGMYLENIGMEGRK
jgi:hypothetical protein